MREREREGEREAGRATGIIVNPWPFWCSGVLVFWCFVVFRYGIGVMVFCSSSSSSRSRSRSRRSRSSR